MARAETRMELPVRGMSCAACAAHLEQALRTVPGVREAAVNFATGRAHVAYDPQAVGRATLVDRVPAAGYQVPLVRLLAVTTPVQFWVGWPLHAAPGRPFATGRRT